MTPSLHRYCQAHSRALHGPHDLFNFPHTSNETASVRRIFMAMQIPWAEPHLPAWWPLLGNMPRPLSAEELQLAISQANTDTSASHVLLTPDRLAASRQLLTPDRPTSKSSHPALTSGITLVPDRQPSSNKRQRIELVGDTVVPSRPVLDHRNCTPAMVPHVVPDRGPQQALSPTFTAPHRNAQLFAHLQWVPILPRVWAEVISHVEVQNIVADIVSDCEHITTGGNIQRLHESVPFTSGHMADAGDRGTEVHFDQSTVGDSWVLIFSCLDVGASGGEFWVADPTVDKAIVVHAGGGTSIILCKAGWFKHGARPVVGGSRVVTVLWNNPRIRDDRIANPRPLLFEDTSSSWPPRSMIASFKESPLRNGLPPKALHKDDLCSWLNQER